jgi:hypothetical protein
MKGLENSTYLVGYIISNIVALIMLWASLKNLRLSRLLFFLLFLWASFTNATISTKRPEVYLEYADLALIGFYRDFILGWFRHNTQWVVQCVAVSQAFIAISMLLRGPVLKTGAILAIIFLVSIAPLGVGSAFPTTLIMAAAMFLILRKNQHYYLWQRNISGAKHSSPHIY